MMAFMARHSSSFTLELSCLIGAPFVSVDSMGVGLPDALLAAMTMKCHDPLATTVRYFINSRDRGGVMCCAQASRFYLIRREKH